MIPTARFPQAGLCKESFRIPKDEGVIPTTAKQAQAVKDAQQRFRIPKDEGVIPTF